jgi:putative PIG3 family NAD(P)H quinone oxidoreductase
MQAIHVSEDHDMHLAGLERPEPGPGEVLLRVRAAGVNRADVLQRAGRYPPPPGAPATMGLECAGEVVALGEGAEGVAVGEAVCALLAGGAYAEYVAVDAGSLLPKPAQLSWTEAASLPESLFTVYANVFDACALAPGERFLVHGGTSGIGVAAIQMAKHVGCEVFTTAGTPEKCARAEALGAGRAIHYREEDFEAVLKELGGVDVILDMVGGDYVQKNINVLREAGRCVNIAYQKGFTAEVNFLRVMLKRLTLTGSTLRARPAAEKRRLRDGLKPVFWTAVEAGAIGPVVDSVFPLDQAARAHARMESGQHVGKIVLEVG